MNDYVYDVLALKTTNYFFTIESMKAPNGAGVLRWDVTKGDCYNRLTANVPEDQGKEYYLVAIEYTRNLAVSSPGAQKIWILNFLNLAKPVVSIAFTSDVGYVGSVTDLNKDPERCLIITCSSIDKAKACTSIDYRKSTPTVDKRIALDAASPTLTAGTRVWVASFPQTDYVAFSWNTAIYVANLGDFTAAIGATPNMVNYRPLATVTPALTEIAMIDAQFEYTDLYVLTGNRLAPVRFVETDPNPRCFEGCPAATGCSQNSFQSSGCKDSGTCNAAGYTFTLGGLPMPCRKIIKNQMPLGGLFVTPKSATPVNTDGETCGSSGFGSTDDALLISLIVGGSLVVLAGVAICICALLSTGSSGGGGYNFY